MPKFETPLTPQRLQERQKGRGTRVDLSEYQHYIQSIPDGGAGNLVLTNGEKKPTVKRRVTMAAAQLGKKVKYLRSEENELVFRIE